MLATTGPLATTVVLSVMTSSAEPADCRAGRPRERLSSDAREVRRGRFPQLTAEGDHSRAALTAQAAVGADRDQPDRDSRIVGTAAQLIHALAWDEALEPSRTILVTHPQERAAASRPSTRQYPSSICDYRIFLSQQQLADTGRRLCGVVLLVQTGRDFDHARRCSSACDCSSGAVGMHGVLQHSVEATRSIESPADRPTRQCEHRRAAFSQSLAIHQRSPLGGWHLLLAGSSCDFLTATSAANQKPRGQLASGSGGFGRRRRAAGSGIGSIVIVVGSRS